MLGRRFRLLTGLRLVPLVLLAGPAHAQFLESVTSIHTWDGSVAGDGWGVVRALGDVDGDGTADYGVGVAANSDNGAGAGKVWIFSGATGDTIRTHVKPAGNHFGYELGGVGDVTGDGRADYVITAPRTLTFLTFNPPGHGRAFLYSGADGTQLHAWRGDLLGAGNREGFGSLTAGLGNTLQQMAGDVNADGVPDIMIGANIHGPPNTGRVWIFSGANPDSILFTFDGEATPDLFGFGGGGLGDLDGDGHDDFCVGAPDAGPGGRGRVYVYSGQTGAEFPFSPLEPDTTGVRYGLFFASGPGDTNGDGTPDIVVGDFLDASLGASTGKVYVYSGVDGSLLYSLTGEAAGDGFGVVRGAGDVNFDGNADLLIGAFSSSAGASTGGKIYVVSGIDGSTIRTMTGTIAGDGLGTSAFPAYDANGDGALDFLVASPGHDTGADGAGRVYVLAGDLFPTDAPVLPEAAAAAELLGGRPNPSRGEVRVAFAAARAGVARLAIHDVSGRLVRILVDGPIPAGRDSALWDGRDRSGRRAAAGVYFARLTMGGETHAETLVRLR